MKSFQAHTQVRMPTVALIGVSSGKMTCQNVVHTLAPSISGGLLELLRDRLQVAGVDEDVERQPVDDVEQDEPDLLSRPSSAVCFATGSMMTGNGTNSAEMK